MNGQSIKWQIGDVIAHGSTSIIYKSLSTINRITFVVKELISTTEEETILNFTVIFVLKYLERN